VEIIERRDDIRENLLELTSQYPEVRTCEFEILLRPGSDRKGDRTKIAQRSLRSQGEEDKATD
jgi:hypothetical protein